MLIKSKKLKEYRAIGNKNAKVKQDVKFKFSCGLSLS